MASSRDQAARNGLFGFMLLVIAVVGAWMLIWPSYKGLRTDQDMQAQTQAQYDEKTKAIGDVTMLINNYKTKKQQLAIIEQALPSAPAVPQLLADLEKIASQSGMKLDNLKVSDTSQDPNKPPVDRQNAGTAIFSTPELVKLKIEMAVSGTYESFPLFLQLIQRNVRLLEIQQVNSETSSEDTRSELPKFNLVITTYYQK